MELRLERTGHTGWVNQTAVSAWSVRAGDDTELGTAMIAEIVAVPNVDALTPEMARHLLALELDGERPTIRVQPTVTLVETDDGTPARMWLGSSAQGLTIAAFVCAIHASDRAFADLLATEIMPHRVVIEAAGQPPDNNAWRLFRGDAALR